MPTSSCASFSSCTLSRWLSASRHSRFSSVRRTSSASKWRRCRVRVLCCTHTVGWLLALRAGMACWPATQPDTVTAGRQARAHQPPKLHEVRQPGWCTKSARQSFLALQLQGFQLLLLLGTQVPQAVHAVLLRLSWRPLYESSAHDPIPCRGCCAQAQPAPQPAASWSAAASWGAAVKGSGDLCYTQS